MDSMAADDDAFSLVDAMSGDSDDGDVLDQKKDPRAFITNLHEECGSWRQLANKLGAASIAVNFAGATYNCLLKYLWLHEHNALPARCYHKEAARAKTHSKYEHQLAQLTLKSLANVLSPEQRSHYTSEGWLKCSLEFTPVELHLIKVLKAVQAAELGVVTTDPSTHSNAAHRTGYDSSFGWIRTPAMSPMHFYSATHPKVYSHFVAVVALSLLNQGYSSDDPQAVRACVEGGGALLVALVVHCVGERGGVERGREEG